MCGIITALSINFPINRENFNQARDSMQHRGPDAAGSVFLQNNNVAIGHRRLSILDLSAAANQPMRLGSLWITFNGEIYNYPELRKDLEQQGCRFVTHTDTEVLLHGYKIWGQRLCNYLSGMFAFAIWDDQNKQLFLARDHLGQKPLYYTYIDQKFVAASEIKALKILLGQRFKMRQESLLDNIIYDFVPEPYTWYQGIECLLPGYNMLVQFDGQLLKFNTQQYWNFSPDPDPYPISQNEALEHMEQEIIRSVKSHLLADVEVGAFLSGGADSTCIAMLASQYLDHPIKTFSIGFGSSDNDELPLARETAHQIGAIHKERIVTETDFRSSLDHVLQIFDQPFADPSLVPTERVSSFAAQDVKVVLTGDGGDEVFGGYNLGWYISPFLSFLRAQEKMSLIKGKGALRLFLKSLFERLYYLILGQQRWHNRKNFLRGRYTKNKIMKLLGSELTILLNNYEPRQAYYKYQDFSLDPFRRAQWLHTKFILPGKMLVKLDRSSMHHSLEARSPFLSHTLVETMLNMPTSIRNPEEQWYKGLFRMWLKDKVPENVLNAQKRGFGIPSNWRPISSDQKNSELLSHCIDASIINPQARTKIKKKSKLFWEFLQIERALETGLFKQ